MRVLMYEEGEVEVKRTLEWDGVYNRWLGAPDWTTEKWAY